MMLFSPTFSMFPHESPIFTIENDMDRLCATYVLAEMLARVPSVTSQHSPRPEKGYEKYVKHIYIYRIYIYI